MAEAMDDRLSAAIILQNLGGFSETPDSILLYCWRAQDIFRELKDDAGIAYSGNTIGAAFVDKGLYEASRPKLKEAQGIFESLQFTPGQSAVYSNLGNLFTFLKLQDSAAFYYNKSITLAEENNNPKQLVETYSNMAKTYASAGQSEKGYTYFEKAMIAKDSLFNQEKAQQLTFAETDYETQQKEKQLIQQELIIQQQQTTQQWVIVGSELALLLLFGIFQYL
ncbi:MAG: two-component system NarL family sensor kinase [Saprospiraceae bacterium]|jgi:two-component system NarL family sensor kinase